MTPRRVDGGGDKRFLYAALICFTLFAICLYLIVR